MIRRKERHSEDRAAKTPAVEAAATEAAEAPDAGGVPNASVAAEAGGAAATAALSAEIEKARAREDELLRALAELQNVSRRRKQEMETSIVYAQESLIRGLLPVLDDIERALEASKDRGDAFRAGLAMIQDRLWRTLEKEGLEAIRPSGGPFDPNLHDAVAQRPAADQSPDTVLEVMLPGYRLRGRVLRHAQVIVAGAPQAKGAAEEQP